MSASPLQTIASRQALSLASVPNLSEALEWLDSGVSVFSLPPGQKRASGKSWGQWRSERPSQYDLLEMFKSGGNLAIVTGPASGGLCVRDFDTVEAYEHFRAANPDLALALPTVRTKRGYHVYFRVKDSVRERYRADVKRIGKNGEEGELRLRHYVVAPPSTVEDFKYEWLIPWTDWPPFIDPVHYGLDRRMQHKQTQEDSCYYSPQKSPSVSIASARVQSSATLKQWNPLTIDLAKLPERLQERVTDLIDLTLPPQFGTRNHQVFEFCRAMHSITEFEGYPATAFVEILRIWHRKALPKIRTKDFSTTKHDFLIGWPNVKYPFGLTMQLALREARRMATPKCAKDHAGNRKKVNLIKLFRALSQEREEFFVSVRTIENLFKVDISTASRWLRGFQLEGILELIQKGRLVGRLASIFRYHGD